MNPFFFGPPARRLYGVYHPPTASQRLSSQVLLCPPFGQEAVRTHRLHRLLADHLSRQGVHVMRFDYFGTGESSGADQDATLTQWRDDILVAHGELKLRTRAQRTAWLGTRLGATLAILASERCEDQPPDRLILWEPILDGPAYLRELGEAHARELYSPLLHTQRPSTTVRDEILGFGVSELWLKQLGELSIHQLNPVCKEACIQLSRAEDATSTAHLSEACRARGAQWQHRPTSTDIAWHTEEAGGSALAPPELLRQLVAASTGNLA
ncbi:serine aminopeptidase domain-containing protein [Aquabacterium sp.]|uniref:serine aminopeptidase domain-containing protein n=1 Tax=Aquabacterium sp. TaxID=1872578 RepID=UPI003D6D4895